MSDMNVNLTPDVDKVYPVPEYVSESQEQGMISKEVQYPCLILESSTDEIGSHILTTLSNVLEPASMMNAYAELEEGKYNVYVKAPSVFGLLGSIHSHRLRVLLDTSLFKCFTIKAYRASDRVFEGEMLYALCTRDF